MKSIQKAGKHAKFFSRGEKRQKKFLTERKPIYSRSFYQKLPREHSDSSPGFSSFFLLVFSLETFVSMVPRGDSITLRRDRLSSFSKPNPWLLVSLLREHSDSSPGFSSFFLPVFSLETFVSMVPRGGLEPPHLSAYAPQAYMYTNFITWAGVYRSESSFFYQFSRKNSVWCTQ